MIDLQEYIHIGKVGKAQGIKGEVRVIIYSGMPADLSACREVVVKNKTGQCSLLAIEMVRWQGKFQVAKFVGMVSRDDAETLSGSEIWLHKSEVPVLPDNQCYGFEYEGLDVVTESGRLLGVVQDVFATGANDVLVVAGLGQEYLIPVINDVIVEVDRSTGKIVIAPLPGLLDMNS